MTHCMQCLFILSGMFFEHFFTLKKVVQNQSQIQPSPLATVVSCYVASVYTFFVFITYPWSSLVYVFFFFSRSQCLRGVSIIHSSFVVHCCMCLADMVLFFLAPLSVVFVVEVGFFFNDFIKDSSSLWTCRSFKSCLIVFFTYFLTLLRHSSLPSS